MCPIWRISRSQCSAWQLTGHRKSLRLQERFITRQVIIHVSLMNTNIYYSFYSCWTWVEFAIMDEQQDGGLVGRPSGFSCPRGANTQTKRGLGALINQHPLREQGLMQKPVHYRRCHVCGTLNQQKERKVENCSQCGKHLCQFFYFDDRLTSVPCDTALRPMQFAGEFYPIQGLTVYWEAF